MAASRFLATTFRRRQRQPYKKSRSFTSTSAPRADFTHAVIGGGAVGLAIARRLQSHGPSVSTVLIERHRHVGTETSSRNSEVIHAGLYYGHGTLKTRLCLHGRRMLYALCDARRIPHSNCGKWIVAQDDAQMAELEKLHAVARELDVPTRFLAPDEARRREPDVRAARGVLESPTTGIVDSHAYMAFLQGDFEDRGGDCALGAAVTDVEAVDGGRGGYRIWTRTEGHLADDEPITAETVVNSAGLAAAEVQNMILPAHRHRELYYAKGSYFSYAAAHPKPTTLVYPAPTPGHGGLGTHLTIDMAGRVRFGPDVEWTDDPTDVKVNASRLAAALDDIQTYLPGLQRDAVDLDYCGIRPKLGRQSSVVGGRNFIDFHIVKEEGFEGFVNLLGIESPGLTSSLAIGEYVHGLLYK